MLLFLLLLLLYLFLKKLKSIILLMFTFKCNFIMMPSVLKKKNLNTLFFSILFLKYEHLFLKNYENIDRNNCRFIRIAKF